MLPALAACAAIALTHACVEQFPSACVRPQSAVLKATATAWCWAYSAFSLLLLGAGLPILLPPLAHSSLYCATLPDTPAVNILLFTYFASKLAEAADLLLVSARGIPVVPHFRFHHYTTPLFAYVGWQSRSAHGAVFLLLNAAMHVMVYAFHAGYQPAALKTAIRRWQYVQLLGGGALGIAALLSRLAGLPCSADGGYLADLVPPVLFSAYFILFQMELQLEERKGQ